MKLIFQIFVWVYLLSTFACTTEKEYQYEVYSVTTGKNAGDKSNRKSTTEFISIAYADLFGTYIPQSKLINLSIAYSSFGDYKVIEERIIKNFLNDSNVAIPQTPSVNGDTLLFISNTYKKFYNRDADEFEKHYWKELIRTNSMVTPAIIYYAMMTSDEYRFY
jgi:hypothetical protein